MSEWQRGRYPSITRISFEITLFRLLNNEHVFVVVVVASGHEMPPARSLCMSSEKGLILHRVALFVKINKPNICGNCCRKRAKKIGHTAGY